MLVDHRHVEDLPARDDDQIENLIILVGCMHIEGVPESDCNKRNDVGKEIIGAMLQAHWPGRLGNTIVSGCTVKLRPCILAV